MVQQIAIGHPVRGNTIQFGPTSTGDAEWGDCRGCGLHRTRKRVSLYRKGRTGTGGIRLIFIGDSPKSLEDTTGVPYSGIEGRILHWMFKLCSANFDYMLTTSVCCRTAEIIYLDHELEQEQPDLETLDYDDYQIEDWDREPTKQESDLCSGHIHELISNYNPAGVVYLGDVAKRFQTSLPKLSLIGLHKIIKLEYKLITLRREIRKLENFINKLENL